MNRLEWSLTALVAVLLIVVVILGVVFWTQPGFGAPPQAIDGVQTPVVQPPAVERSTALIAFNKARDAANLQQEDAQLVKASATWPLGASREDLVSGEAIWNFTFYSRATNQAIVISVIENEAQVIQERNVATSPTLHDASGWQIDSSDAVRHALTAGGDDLLQDGGSTTLTASLTTTTDTEQIQWFISLISKYTGKSFTVRLDANSGEILSVEEAS
jgi:hypothetical protein